MRHIPNRRDILLAEPASRLIDMADFSHKVSGISESLRISEYLRLHLGFTGALITKVKYGNVYLNGDAVHMRAEVSDGDIIEVNFPEERSYGIEPMDIPLQILFEDEHLLAVNKPTSMPTHPSRGNSLPTLANAVMGYFGGHFVFRAITRLDRDTSGIVLIAKTQYAAARLSDDMKSGKIKKIYTTVAKGIPSAPCGRIDAPIRRDSEGSMKRVVADDGKQAITDYKLIGTTLDGNSVLQIELLTGRTHQIRVHMAYIGHPLVGDFLYGERRDAGYMLHCTELEFSHPTTREIIKIESKAPFI